jgi:hypothetical protein
MAFVRSSAILSDKSKRAACTVFAVLLIWLTCEDKPISEGKQIVSGEDLKNQSTLLWSTSLRRNPVSHTCENTTHF